MKKKIIISLAVLLMVWTAYFYTYTADGKSYDDKSIKTLSINKIVYDISNILKWSRFDGYIIVPNKNKKIVRYYYKKGQLNGTRMFDDLELEKHSCMPQLLKK
jgi:hypothetical protein